MILILKSHKLNNIMSKNKTIIGVITKLDLLKAPKGHTPHFSGTGVWKNRRKDKKARRQADKNLGE